MIMSLKMSFERFFIKKYNFLYTLSNRLEKISSNHLRIPKREDLSTQIELMFTVDIEQFLRKKLNLENTDFFLYLIFSELKISWINFLEFSTHMSNKNSTSYIKIEKKKISFTFVLIFPSFNYSLTERKFKNI